MRTLLRSLPALVRQTRTPPDGLHPAAQARHPSPLLLSVDLMQLMSRVQEVFVNLRRHLLSLSTRILQLLAALRALCLLIPLATTLSTPLHPRVSRQVHHHRPLDRPFPALGVHRVCHRVLLELPHLVLELVR